VTILTCVIDAELSGLRLDVALSRALVEHQITRSSLQRLIAEGHVKVEGNTERSSYKVRSGQTIAVEIPEIQVTSTEPEAITLSVVYEDSDVVVIDKPQGMVVHPAPGNYSGTLVNALLHHVDDLSGIGGEQRPGIVHRLDKDTTGLLVVAKNDRSHVALQQQLAARTMKREYIAILHGNVKKENGTVKAPIGRHPQRRKEMAVVQNGRESITHYTVEERFSGYTLTSLRLQTGRTHQIRVHMAYIGHPVVGDPVYGPKKAPFTLPGQMLHARALTFIHPTSGEELRFFSSPPAIFMHLLSNLRKTR